MSFSFSDFKTGRVYKVEGPGLTEAQARQIFEGQLSAGSLVGLKPGMVLDAAQQAVGGLAGAAAQATQGLQQALGSVASTAGTAVKNITSSAFGGVPTNGINVADFAQQTPALGNIAQLGQTAVTSSLAQASRLVGQASNAISNTAGVGKFGLDASQLERAGMIKPGTTSTYLAQGQNALTDVLRSPAVWTGQGGINGVDDLLASVPTQDRIQQQLMQSGATALGELGIPVSELSPQALAGTVLNAAKSVTDAFAWATGGTLPSSIASAFDQVAKDGAFAVGFGETKISDAMKQETPPEESVDTVDRDTVNAAASRVVGNEKVPPVDYNTPATPVSARALFEENLQLLQDLTQISTLSTVALKGETAAAGRQDLNGLVDVERSYEKLLADVTALESKAKNIKQRALALVPQSTEEIAEAEKNLARAQSRIADLERYIDRIKQRIAALRL